jgi:hypothetical protein
MYVHPNALKRILKIYIYALVGPHNHLAGPNKLAWLDPFKPTRHKDHPKDTKAP